MRIVNHFQISLPITLFMVLFAFSLPVQTLAATDGVTLVADKASFAETASAAENAFAATNSLFPKTSCSLGLQIQTLKEKESSSSETPEILALRKTILKKILTCAIDEASLVAEQIKTFHFEDNSAGAVTQHRIVEELGRAAEFYSFQINRVDDLGLYGTRQFARTVIEWRTSNYAPLVANAGNFVLWTKNQSLFTAAQKRFDQIKSTVSTLKLVDNEEIPAAFSRSESLFSQAKSADSVVAYDFKTNLSPDVTLADIRKSLSLLSQTYASFFEVSDLVLKILPH
jgi:hypothetical protein